MSVKIGHASQNELGKVSGGAKGDNNGKEVCIRTWYSRGWNVMLRPKNASLAEKSARACEDGCRNDNIGYSQTNRNTLHAEAKHVGYDLAKITTPCETDCSAFMTICAIAGGAKNLEYTTNAPTTSTMRKAFGQSGLYEVHTEQGFLTSDKYLRRGDILVAEGNHTAMVLSDGSGAKETKKVSYAVVTKSPLNVREDAGKEYPVLFTLPKNMVVAICEEKDGWGRVTDIQGWISLNTMYITR